MYENTTVFKYVLCIAFTKPRGYISVEDKQRIVDALANGEGYVETARLLGTKRTKPQGELFGK